MPRLRNTADIGFAQDMDADRLAIVSEQGNPIGEEPIVRVIAEARNEARARDVVAKYMAKWRHASVHKIDRT